MKNGLLFLFVAIILCFSSCSFKDDVPKVVLNDMQPIQQEISTSGQEEIEEPEETEFTIEATYDPVLAEKAAENKRKKTEITAPITLTDDDDDLEEDKDDLPIKVRSRSIKAYDYQSTNDDILNDSENTFKGEHQPTRTTTIDDRQVLYFVIGGAYKDEKEAQIKIDIIEKLGYKVELISFDKNFKTVCIAKLESRNQADLLAKSLQDEKIDVYVVKRRK